MTQAMMKKTTNWMPAVRHRRSQLGVLMRVSLLLSTFQLASKYDADARQLTPGIPAWGTPAPDVPTGPGVPLRVLRIEIRIDIVSSGFRRGDRRRARREAED